MPQLVFAVCFFYRIYKKPQEPSFKSHNLGKCNGKNNVKSSDIMNYLFVKLFEKLLSLNFSAL